jgi:hypothetical protein
LFHCIPVQLWKLFGNTQNIHDLSEKLSIYQRFSIKLSINMLKIQIHLVLIV